jgi:hypothetical protein
LNEKLRLDLAHDFVDFHATERFVNTPTLTGGIATPDETDIVVFADGVKVTGDRFALAAVIRQILKPGLDINILPSGQIG